MSACCREYGCKRKMPYFIGLGPFSRRWKLLTRYTTKPSLNDPDKVLIEALEKHDIHDQLVAALLREGWTPPPGEAE
jgi:hypothetical protein